MEWTDDFARILREQAAKSPRVGATVRVKEGRKHLGVVGQVTWHGRDNFSNAYRYCDGWQAHMRDANGTWGFRVRVQPEDGESFFIAADKVEVVEPSAAQVAFINEQQKRAA